MTNASGRPRLSRRGMLKLQGAAIAAGAAAVAAPEGLLDTLAAPTAMAQGNATTASDPPLPPAAVIVLNRLAFGPKPGSFDYATFNSMAGATPEAKLGAWVDWQLNPGGIADAECDQKLAAAGLATMGQSLTQLWANYYKAQNADRTRPVREVRAAAFIRATYSKRQLQEVLADFWHNHFSVYAWDYAYASATYMHYDRDVIRANMWGRFRTFLEAVATSPAMLYYLDNYVNEVGGPNENYARELFELHTLGAENYYGTKSQSEVPKWPNTLVPLGYVDGDIYEATRCFTGWRLKDGRWPVQESTGEFYYFKDWHDRFQKKVLSPTPEPNIPPDQGDMKDGRDVLDLLASHPGTARFICRKLIRRLVTDDPPEALVEAAAAKFLALQNDSAQLLKVVRFIICQTDSGPAAPDCLFLQTYGQKVKRPFESAVGALRAVNANFTPTDSFFWRYDAMGQALFGRRSPDGYPDVRRAWTNTTTMLKRWQLVIDLLRNSIDDKNSVNVVTQSGGNTASSIADHWINRVLGRPLAGAPRQAIVDFMRGSKGADSVLTSQEIDERLKHMVALVIMTPEFQWR